MSPSTLLIHTLIAFLLGSALPYSAPVMSAPSFSNQVSESLQRMLAHSDSVSFLVILDEQPDPNAILSSPQMRNASALERRTHLYESLTALAREEQAPIREWLARRGVPFRSFYIINALEVEGDIQIAQALARRPDVDRLVANPEIELTLPEQPVEDGVEAAESSVEIPYGIRYARAPEVWALGHTGKGITIASQDTGVLWTHPALRSSYRGWDASRESVDHVYNWFDPWGSDGRPLSSCESDPQVPCDDFGHGTHTVGTLVGREDGPAEEAETVGMAPDANWIGCRNMKNGNGTPGSYTSCFEFFLAPYPQGGDPLTDGDPSKAPHIINNSWYCPPQEGCDFDSLQQVVSTVRAAGMLIVASAGNNGPSCSTVKYPISGYAGVFSIGAHNGTGTVTGFSSRGPVTADGSNRLKPDIMAAGDGVRSAGLDGGYKNSSGTSMASPHVAGAAALLWSAQPDLVGELDRTEQILLKSATPVPSAVCDSDSEVLVPNNTYGYGRLDALAAVEMALKPSTLSATISWSGGDRVADAEVVLIDDLTGYRVSAVSNSSGTVTFEHLTPGHYRLEATSGMAYGSQRLLLLAGEKKSSLVRVERWLHLPAITRS